MVPPEPVPGEPAPAESESRPYRGPDRRQRPTARISRWSIHGGRRRAVRRTEEREGSFVDRYSTRLLLCLMWIALMNSLDSFFTLVHLQAGGVELNPIAQLLLETGRQSFVLLKSVLIAGALIVLCMHKNFFLARVGIWTSATAYTALVIYHLALFRVV